MKYQKIILDRNILREGCFQFSLHIQSWERRTCGWKGLSETDLRVVAQSIMGFVEIQITFLVPCRRASMYTNGKYLSNTLWENPENRVVSLNPSLCLACMALMTRPYLLLLGSSLTTVLSFTMLQPSYFPFYPFNSTCSSLLGGPAPALTCSLDLECSPFSGLAPHPKGKPFWSTLPEGGTTSNQSVSSPSSYLFPS